MRSGHGDFSAVDEGRPVTPGMTDGAFFPPCGDEFGSHAEEAKRSHPDRTSARGNMRHGRLGREQVIVRGAFHGAVQVTAETPFENRSDLPVQDGEKRSPEFSVP